MKHSRQSLRQTRRDAWVDINISHLEHNAKLIRQHWPNNQALMAVLKADAYGHGASMVIPTLAVSGVSMIGVATVDEGLELREAGVDLPILVLGASPDWAMQPAIAKQLTLTVFSDHHITSLKSLAGEGLPQAPPPYTVHIKIDTGMHRIGVDWTNAVDFIIDCLKQPFLRVEGVFSHFACAEDSANPNGFTAKQLGRWQTLQQLVGQQASALKLTMPPLWHVANSAALWGLPQNSLTPPPMGCTMARVGLGFLGYGHPLLKPVMGLKARIVHLQTVLPGDGISYGQCYQVPNDSLLPKVIATLPLGYADGVPRRLSNQMQAILHGNLLPQVGNITMDQLMVDVSAVIATNDVQVGDAITLLGSDEEASINLTNWATTVNTIEYELMCGLRVRLPKVFVRN
jgi:alanine racemase